MIDRKRRLMQLSFALRKTGGIAMTSKPFPLCVLWISKSSPLVRIVIIILINLWQFGQSHTMGFIFVEYNRPPKTVLPSVQVVCAKRGSGHTIPSVDRHPPL